MSKLFFEQAITEGVDFRFTEVRGALYELCGKDSSQLPPKPMTVNVNFRSHAGVLNVAAKVLEILMSNFPGSAKKLPPDVGKFTMQFCQVSPNLFLCRFIPGAPSWVAASKFDTRVDSYLQC